MNTRTFLPAMVSLALLFASPVFAQAQIDGLSTDKSASVTTVAVAQKKFDCRKYANYHDRSRCREIHSIPDTIN